MPRPALKIAPTPAAAALADAKAASAAASSRYDALAPVFRRLEAAGARVAELKAELVRVTAEHAEAMRLWATTGLGEQPDHAQILAGIRSDLDAATADEAAARAASGELAADARRLHEAAVEAAAAVEDAAIAVALDEHAALIDECARRRDAYLAALTEVIGLEQLCRQRAEAARVASDDAGRAAWLRRANALSAAIAPLRLDGALPMNEVTRAAARWAERLRDLQRGEERS